MKKKLESFTWSNAPTCYLNQTESMKDIESQAIEYAEALNDIADVLDMPTGATSAEIVKQARNRWSDGIHSCHDHCMRERCVERRNLKTMREALEAADECLALIEDVEYRAQGYVKHREGIRGHQLIATHGGGAKCSHGNCEINQPCDARSMRSFRRPNGRTAAGE